VTLEQASSAELEIAGVLFGLPCAFCSMNFRYPRPLAPDTRRDITSHCCTDEAADLRGRL